MREREYKVGNKKPPEHTRFPVNRKDHTQKHPDGYLTPLLKKFLNKTITYDDPETLKKIKGKVKDAVIWRLLLNACQGENTAIKEILDRIDGKVVQEVKGEGFDNKNITQIYQGLTVGDLRSLIKGLRARIGTERPV